MSEKKTLRVCDPDQALDYFDGKIAREEIEFKPLIVKQAKPVSRKSKGTREKEGGLLWPKASG